MTVWLAPRIIVGLLLCGFVPAAFGQAASTERIPAQSAEAAAPIRVESDLVLVRVEVLDRKVWNKGPTKAGTQCFRAEEQAFARLSATEPYVPNDCLGLPIRGLAIQDFHVFVDGLEQKIRNVTTASAGTVVRDNQNWHYEYSHSPVGKWSTPDNTGPMAEGYGPEVVSQYEVSFVPVKSGPSGCHEIKVKVDRRDSIVHARTEYCASESPSDTLNGSVFGKELEQALASEELAKMTLSLQAGVFSTGTDRGRARIVVEFPWDALRRKWKNDWTLDASIGVLGMVYKRDGSAATRFSDLACCSSYQTAGVFGMKGETVDQFLHSTAEAGLSLSPSMMFRGFERSNLPARYETQTDLPAGEYNLRVVLSDGEKFGRAEAHLTIEKHDGKELTLSSVMLCKRFRDAHVAAVETAAANFAPQYVPMVSNGIQVSPAGDTNFRPGEPLIPYLEIYAPQAVGKPAAQIQAQIRIVDQKSGAVVKDFPPVDTAPYMQPGSTTIPIAREVPIAALPKGEYRLEVQASDSTGRTTPWRSASFTIAKEN